MDLVLKGVEVEVEISEDGMIRYKENEEPFAPAQAPFIQFVTLDSPVYTSCSQSEASALLYKQPPHINLLTPSSRLRGISTIQGSSAPLHTIEEIMARWRAYQKEQTRLHRKVHQKKWQKQLMGKQKASGEIGQGGLIINFGIGNSTVHIGHLVIH